MASRGRKGGNAMPTQCAVRAVTYVFVIVTLVVSSWAQQHMSSFERGRALDMLKVISGDVRKHYYDPKFHGVDFAAQVNLAKQRIEGSSSFNIAMSHIAAALDSLDDSHTSLMPPQLSSRLWIPISDCGRAMLYHPSSPPRRCRDQRSQARGRSHRHQWLQGSERGC